MNFKLSQKAVISINTKYSKKIQELASANGKYLPTVVDVQAIAVQTGCVANNQKRREFYGSLPFFLIS